MLYLALALAAGSVQVSSKNDGIVSISDPKTVVTFLQNEGYKANFEPDAKYPVVRSGVEGVSFSITFYGCKANRDCDDVMFSSSYAKDEEKPVTIEQINNFNMEKRWTRAYLDKEREPTIEMDVLFTDRQVRAAAFRESLELWADALAKFHKAIDY